MKDTPLTPGAVRAAALLCDHDGATSQYIERCARIIDRETATPETPTLRDHFAGLAMAALIGVDDGGAGHTFTETVQDAYKFADTMMAEHERRQA